MADIKLSLVNQALVAAGEDPITGLAGADTPMAIAAIQQYDDIVNEELVINEPMFAKKVLAPTLLTAVSDSPLKYRWQLPADVLSILSVLYIGVVQTGDLYEIEGAVIRSYYNTDITVKYIYRPDESVWTFTFRKIIRQRLEALFLRVTERHNEADGRDAATERSAMIARHADARQRSNRPIHDGSIIEARFGQRRRR